MHQYIQYCLSNNPQKFINDDKTNIDLLLKGSTCIWNQQPT